MAASVAVDTAAADIAVVSAEAADTSAGAVGVGAAAATSTAAAVRCRCRQLVRNLSKNSSPHPSGFRNSCKMSFYPHSIPHF